MGRLSTTECTHLPTYLNPIGFREIARGWLGRPSLSRVLGSGLGRSMGLCFSPRTCMPLRRWDLGMGYGWKLSVYFLEARLP